MMRYHYRYCKSGGCGQREEERGREEVFGWKRMKFSAMSEEQPVLVRRLRACHQPNKFIQCLNLFFNMQ